MKDIKQIVQEAHERTATAIADEAEDQKENISSLDWILRQMPAWKRWYLKKNQPDNYFRITCSIPYGMEDRPYLHLCRFQVWVKNKLTMDYRIDKETYQFLYCLQDWQQSKNNPNHYLYHPHI